MNVGNTETLYNIEISVKEKRKDMNNQVLKATFNNVVGLYDKYRPTYVDDLYKDIFEYKSIDDSSITVEIGIGTGQATRQFLDTGTKLIAVELGKELAAFVSGKYEGYDNFEVVNSSFEDFRCEAGSIDMIYSATAFHWLDEEEGYSKVFRLLKQGGVFARFANRPYKDKENLALDPALQEVYNKFMPNNKPGTEFDEVRCVELANIPLKYGFSDIEYKLYKRTRVFTADEYISLVGTYSHTIALEENKRQKFLDEIRDVINAHGGNIKIFDTIDLQLARK